MENTKSNVWALVTGASSGIGKSFSIRLASDGYNLILVARRSELLEKLKVELTEKYGVEVIFFVSDLSNQEDTNLLINSVKDKTIKVLINNAGFGLHGEFINEPIDNYIKMINLNCIAPVILTKSIIDKMKSHGGGQVFFLGSVLSFMPSPFSAVYAATKAFDESLASGLWYELKKYNIDVISINPGSTKTEFHDTAKMKLTGLFRFPEQVVETAFKNIGKKPSVNDGIFNNIFLLVQKFVGRKLFVKLTGKIFEKSGK